MDNEKLERANKLSEDIRGKKVRVERLTLAATNRSGNTGGTYSPSITSFVCDTGWKDVVIFEGEKAAMVANLALAEAQAELKKLEDEFASL